MTASSFRILDSPFVEPQRSCTDQIGHDTLERRAKQDWGAIVTFCHGVILEAADRKQRVTDGANLATAACRDWRFCFSAANQVMKWAVTSAWSV